jgi:hypothetical protein
MIAAVRPDRAEALIEEWRAAGEEVFAVGEVIEGSGVDLAAGA